MLISRSLVKEGLLEHPVVSMSSYINEHRDEYVDLLLQISLHGGDYWSRWIRFIMEAIRTQAIDAVQRSERLIELRETYRGRLSQDNAPPRLFDVVDSLFSLPALNVRDVTEKTDVSKPTAAKDLARLERLRILKEYTEKAYDRDWLAPEIVEVIQADSLPS